jgi:hypothetical protein
LKLVSFANAVSELSTGALLDAYSDRFTGIGKMANTQVKLHINSNVTPIQQKLRRIPFHLRPKVEEELERLEKLDIIEKAEGPTSWISPVVIVPKSSSPEPQVCLCLDSKAINTAIDRERAVIPTLDDLEHDLNGAKVLSVIDLNKGYHQLELSPESRDITTFTTHQGLYRYKRLCFGINSAAELFQRKIEEMLHGIDGVRNMSDDIIVYAKSEKEHDIILQKVLQRMREFNITANVDKCKFKQSSVTYFGHIFPSEGMSPTPSKVSAIVEASAPTNASEVRSFLGMAQYLSHFIASYSDIVASLFKLTHKDCKFPWGDVEQAAFLRILCCCWW